ncbi:hypothetical protein EVG20_g3942 [Dentipellis fragilis]|uniref:Inner centromere protein ARK-binding domain-containing protein n=1 Tax=Dentipellis fragilis TaxID=205917 RepID=A0A4Y9Z0A1_9AGAM|nr:hypothetical protein EVG20_g3942 [Dentipellis fragilis]
MLATHNTQDREEHERKKEEGMVERRAKRGVECIRSHDPTRPVDLRVAAAPAFGRQQNLHLRSAKMSEDGAGIIAWATTIRKTMTNDPGRQMLDDKIQSRGFLFLDDYLDNILSGGRQEAIVDLVKTPGRKKDMPKRTRAATAASARSQATIALTFDLEDSSKENVAPMNKFHESLLQAKSSHADASRALSPQRQQSAKPLEEPTYKPASKQKSVKIAPESESEPDLPTRHEPEEPEEREEQDDHFIEVMSSSPQPQAASLPDIIEEDADVRHGPSLYDATTPARTKTDNELSIIAEDEEEPTERSRTQADRTPSVQPPEPERQPSPLLAPVEDYMSEGEDAAAATEDVPMDQDFTQTSAPTMFPSPVDFTVPLRDLEDVDSALKRKPSLSQFHSLPAPSPLRKSMRIAREPSVGPTPGGPASKRSSWLTKAREAANTKRTSTIAVAAPSFPTAGPSSGSKRKSGDMLAGLMPSSSATSIGDEGERRTKLAKTSGESLDGLLALPRAASHLSPVVVTESIPHAPSAPNPIVQLATPPVPLQSKSADDIRDAQDESESDRVLYRLKKTLENKNAGALLGTVAATELAEAKAAALARIAERNKAGAEAEAKELSVVRESMSAPTLFGTGLPLDKPRSSQERKPSMSNHADSSRASGESDRRLSLSDLVPKSGEPNSKAKGSEVASQSSNFGHGKNKEEHVGDLSTSTTPPNSPPAAVVPQPAPPAEPVFKKPSRVFTAPIPASHVEPTPAPTSNAGQDRASDFSFKLPPSTTFPPRNPFTVGLQPQMPSTSRLSPPRGAALTAHSTQASMFSDAVFDSQNDVPAWMPTTQDTTVEASPFGSKSKQTSRDSDLDDDDDSWRLEDKFGATNQMWTPFALAGAGAGSKDDSMTWSTLPTESQRADSGPLFTETQTSDRQENNSSSRPKAVPSTFDMEVDELGDQGMLEIDLGQADMQDFEDEIDSVAEAGKSTVSLVSSKADTKSAASQSQASVASSSQSSQMGFFGKATNMVSNMLGGSKKGKPEPPKSIHLAAVAAKKHQEEQDRKAQRLKEMEARRQAALQRKADEEKVKVEEEQRKAKEESERRKKEREEHTGKRPLTKASEKKSSDDDTKKRKVVVEIEKKPDVSSKKPPSKEKKDPAPSRLAKPTPNSKPSSKALSKQPSSSTLQAGSSKATSSTAKGKAANKDGYESDVQPSKQIKADMAARMKAQVQAGKHPESQPIPSEMIELPEPNSEYSDSDDESRPSKFDAPEWAQSPELRAALESQATVNPDEIFGAIRPLRMEDMFRTRHSRFRARTSSANWSGPDGLTGEEEREYARRMGFRS